MRKCDFPGCDEETDYLLPFKCNYCGGHFCPDHRLPSMHFCSGILGWRSKPPPTRAIPAKYSRRRLSRPLEKPHYKFDRRLTFKKSRMKKKKRTIAKAILVIFILLSTATIIYTNPEIVPSLRNTLDEHIAIFNESWTDFFTPLKQYTPDELRDYALQLINEDRAKYGLEPVVLGNNSAAQLHAEDMLKNKFISHWGSDGSKPYVRYTKQGGGGFVAENAAFSGFFYYEPYAARINPKEEIQKHEHQMMYQDAESNWGHRDNILDKYHNKVNIGIAYDGTHLAYVQDFENDYISWSEPISYNSGILSMAGTSSLGEIESIVIYYDSTPRPLNQSQLLSPAYSGAYGLGDEVGYIIKPGYYMIGAKYVEASRWSVSGGSFSIRANIQPLLYKGSGVYTVVIWARNGNDYIPLTTHSLFI